MRQEVMGFGMAVASAGPYANSLHLAPDRKPHHHLNTVGGTHTHPFNGPLSGTTQVSRYQKGGTVDVNLLMMTMSVAVESR